MPLFRTYLACAVVFALSVRLSAQVPSISTTQPQAVAPGAATDLKLRGGNLAGAADLWTSFGGQSALTPDIKDNGKNAAEVTWRVNVPANTPAGVYGVRVATGGGVSALKLLLVDDLPSVAAAGNNTSRGAAQELKLPTAVDGVVQNLQLNYYRFNVAAGQKVSFEVVARRLGSALDPILRILDANGRELAWSDDESGLRSDCRVCYTFKDAGTYIAEVRDIRYTGGGAHFYRLRVGDFPCVSAPYPLAVQRGQTAKVSLAGPETDGVAPFDVTAPSDPNVNWVNVSSKRNGGASSGFAALQVSSTPEAVEAEPNNELAKATRVELGHGVNGRIDQPGDIDHFILTAKKGQKYTFTGTTRRQGSPTSLYLRLLNKDGGQLAAKEDFGVADATFDYTFPADGDYVIAVEDLHRHGGPQFAYRIAVEPTITGFVLNASANTVNIGAGSTTAVTVTSVRKGYKGPIQLTATDLPEGVTSVPTVLGPGINSVVMTLRSTANAPLNKAVPIRIVGTAKIGDADYRATASTETPLKAGLSAVSWAPQNLASHVGLSVGPQPQIRLRTEPPMAVFGKSLTGTVKVIAERADGFNEAIALAVTPDPKKGGLPGNITAGLKPIAKDTNEIAITFSGTDKAPLGDFTVVLNATIKQGKTTVNQTVPGITLRLQAPLTVAVAPAAQKLAAGGTLKMKVTAQRNPALKGEVALTFANLPKGVTAAPAKIAADASEVEVTLTAAADAAKGAVNNIQVKGEVTVGKTKFAGTSPNVAVTVE